MASLTDQEAMSAAQTSTRENSIQTGTPEKDILFFIEFFKTLVTENKRLSAGTLFALMGISATVPAHRELFVQAWSALSKYFS